MIIRNNIGERIAFFRRLNNYTQKYLGELLGFSDKTCDVRVAQYESGDRIPKYDMLEKIASLFNISPEALDIPNINYWARRMHIFFAMEDKYGSEIMFYRNGLTCIPPCRKAKSPNPNMIIGVTTIRRGEITIILPLGVII